ncbi:hypothetical protein MT997_32165 [Paenibacillus sp. OVF10]|nr:hypothetical protein MT997_32165 [Paenibacillus sp. OVF10]
MQNQSEEAKRSPLSPDFLFGKEIKKSGDNSDRKMVLQSELPDVTYEVCL